MKTSRDISRSVLTRVGLQPVWSADRLVGIDVLSDGEQLFGVPVQNPFLGGSPLPGPREDGFWISLKSALENVKQQHGKFPSRILVTMGAGGVPIPEWFLDFCRESGMEIRNTENIRWRMAESDK